MPRAKFLSREARVRASALLDMLYTPSELAEELCLDVRHVYKTLIPAGLPHTRDDTGHLWLHGPEVARWLSGLKSSRRPLAPNEAYCMKCRDTVTMVNPKRVKTATFILLKATCPKCQSKINRGLKSR